ncbi:MAG: permease-like cell division protein FtsX [bacterium]|nr:permease-like cell division protein FtsX [bacterium]
MFWTNTKRIFRSGLLNFWRHGIVSLSSILVMVVALSMIGSTILLSAYLHSTLKEIQDKIDINVYFHTDTTEEGVLKFKQSLENLPEVFSVSYVSKEQALADFKMRHENDELTLQALSELSDNPLRPVLNVKAKETSQYENIAKFLDVQSPLSEGGTAVVEKVNYNDNKNVIDKLTKIIAGVQKLGLIGTVVLIIISILITFNTIRLAIYTAREEIGVMRLVGADNRYIRGPFIVEGILYGVASAVITLSIFYPLTLWIKNNTVSFYGGIDLFQYYVANFWQILSIILASGVALGVIASFFAVRRYLNI